MISLRDNKGIDTSDLENYKHTFQEMQENEDIAGLFKVPILLRMIVQNCYEPSSENRVSLYRDLFNKTLFRQGLGSQLEHLHSIYRDIAFRIFVFDDDCAEINKNDFKEITDSDSCLYQYYLHTPKGESGRGKTNIYRVTFLHRSFYSYFLSEFFYEKLKSVTDVQSGEDFLKYLWPRHMDPYVLDNLRLLAKDKEIDCMQVLRAIGETDAFLSEYMNTSALEKSIGNYDKASNVFWNAISVCNRIFPNNDSQKKMEVTGRVIELLSKYNCTGIALRCSSLGGADLSGADLTRADLQGAYLQGAYLRRAYLEGAELQGADLQGADLRRADLRRAYLQGARLGEARLQKANLCDANLYDANLCNAILSGAYLQGADLQGADLRRADLQGADLRGAYLHLADLCLADLRGAYLRRAYLQRADLRGARLQGADLSGAYLRGADLRGAYLHLADLRDANLEGADLQGANLGGADLTGAIMDGAKLQDNKS